jgi:hypothetical protein
MTKIDSKELSDVELGAVSGGDFTITVPTPSKQTVVNVGAAVGAVSTALSPAVGAVTLLFEAGRNTGANQK